MENRNENTKALVEAGMISALMVILSLVIVYTGLGQIFAVSILPIPITILFLRQNMKTALIASLISTILVALLFNPIQAVANTLLYGLVGVGLGTLLKTKLSVGKILGLFGLLVALASCLYLIIYANFVYKLGIDGFIDLIVKQNNMASDITKNLMGNVAKNPKEIAQMDLIGRYLNKDFILKTLPAMIIFIGYGAAYLNLLITRAVLRRLRIKTIENISFTKIYISNKIAAFMIIIFLIGGILSSKKIFIGESITISSIYVIGTILLLQGMSLTAYFLMNKYSVSRNMVLIILAGTFMFNLYMAFIILGVIDLVMNFRKLDPNPILKN
ncbi:MAG: DUF2232 domain-containing protein [Clostridiaceae bacterium]|nr:DUF2232 domain-containing protein [Clostridiaceae bacterium]